MDKERLYEAIGDIRASYVQEAHAGKAGAKKMPVWVKWGAMAACLCLAVCCAVLYQVSNHAEGVATPGIADAAPMVYVHDTLYKQSAGQTSYGERKDEFVYLGVVESDSTADADGIPDGVPKENFQANQPIVGAVIYQYGENIVIQIDGKYWLYEAFRDEDRPDAQGEPSEEAKTQLDPSYAAN